MPRISRVLAAGAATAIAIGFAAPALATPPDPAVLIARGEARNAAVHANTAGLAANALAFGDAALANASETRGAVQGNAAELGAAARANGAALGAAGLSHAAETRGAVEGHAAELGAAARANGAALRDAGLAHAGELLAAVHN